MGIERVGKMIGKGINDIAQSLNTPSSSRRMKIGQMPASRSDIPIVSNWNTGGKTLKDPRYGNRDFGSRNPNK